MAWNPVEAQQSVHCGRSELKRGQCRSKHNVNYRIAVISNMKLDDSFRRALVASAAAYFENSKSRPPAHAGRKQVEAHESGLCLAILPTVGISAYPFGMVSL